MYRLALNPRRLARRYLVRGPRVFNLLRRIDVAVRSGRDSRRTDTIPVTTVPTQQYEVTLVRGASPEVTTPAGVAPVILQTAEDG
jgi:hypothetical protein